MKPKEDAFGQMIWAHYRGKDVFEVWERSDGYITVDPTKTYFSEYEDWALHQRKAMEFVKGRVLDVGCGAGSITQLSGSNERKGERRTASRIGLSNLLESQYINISSPQYD